MKYLKSTVVYAVAAALPGVTGLLLLPLYSHMLSVSEYAIIAAMGTVSIFVSSFINLALDRAAQRFYFDTADEEEKKKVFGTFFLATWFISLGLLGVVLLMAPLLQMSFPSIPFYPYFFLTILTAVIFSHIVLLQQYYRVREQAVSYFLLFSSLLFLQVGLTVFFIYYMQWGAFGQIFALFIAASLLLPVVYVLSYRNYVFKVNWKVLHAGIKYSWPFIPTLLIAWALNWSDQLFITHLLGMQELGLYSMAYKVSMIFFMVTTAISMVFAPYFFRNANLPNQEGVKTKLGFIINNLASFLVLMAVVIALFSYEIVHLLLDEKYFGIENMIRLLLISHLASGVMSVSSNLYYLQSKRTGLQLFVVFVSVVVNLALNYLLIPLFGIYGAIYATVLSMLILFVIHYNVSKRCYFIPVSFLSLLALFCGGALSVLLFIWQGESLVLKVLILIVFLLLILIRKGDVLKVMVGK